MSGNTSKRWVTGFEPWHLKALNLRHSDSVALSHIDRESDVQLKGMQKGTAFTGFSEGEIIGGAGIIPIWPGVGHAWVTMGANYKKHRIWVHKNVMSFMDKIIEGMELNRVQANVVCDFYPGGQWLERMGFNLEGKMQKYGPEGEDHYLYARIIA